MIKIWYNGDMDAETPEYYIYNDKTRIGWIKNVDEDGYIDEILIYNSYRNMGYGKEALITLMNLEKRDLKLVNQEMLNMQNQTEAISWQKSRKIETEAWEKQVSSKVNMQKPLKEWFKVKEESYEN